MAKIYLLKNGVKLIKTLLHYFDKKIFKDNRNFHHLRDRLKTFSGYGWLSLETFFKLVQIANYTKALDFWIWRWLRAHLKIIHQRNFYNKQRKRCKIFKSYVLLFFNELFSFSGVLSSGSTRWRWKATLRRISVEQFIPRDSFLNVKRSTAQWMLFWIIREFKLMSFVKEVYANCYSKLPAFCVSDSSCAERRKEHRQSNDTIKMSSEAVEALKFWWSTVSTYI